MPAILKVLISLITSKVGGIGGFLLNKILEYGGRALADAFNDFFRSKKQKAAEDKVKKDIADKAPRSEESKKHEDDWINS